MSLIKPDRYFSRISAIDVTRDLVNEDINAVLLDVDNTLLSRADHTVPSDVLLWLKLKLLALKLACFLIIFMIMFFI